MLRASVPPPQDTRGTAPPSYESALELPPAYEQAIYNDYYSSRQPDAAPLRDAQFESGPVRTLDFMHSERLRFRIGFFALAMLVVNFVVIILSIIAKRHFGVFFAANCLSLVVFLIGLLLAFPWSPPRRISLAQLYFFCLMLMLFAGMGLFVAFIADSDAKIHNYCKHVRGGAESWCRNPAKQSKLRTAAIFVAIFGLIGYSLLFSHYARVTFVYTVSVARQFLSADERNSSCSYRTVWGVARWLPRYAHLWRKTRAWCAGACSTSCDACGACVSACTCRDSRCSEDFFVWACMCVCGVCCVASFIICFAASGAFAQLGCIMLDIILQIMSNIH